MSCRHMILGVDERKQRKAKQKKAKAKKGKKKKKDDTDEDEEDEDEDETDPDEEEERAALYKRRMPPAHPSVEVCLSLVSVCHVMLVQWRQFVLDNCRVKIHMFDIICCSHGIWLCFW